MILTKTIDFSSNQERSGTQTRPIDETDAKILTALLAESRTSFTELAEKTGVSVTAAIRRYTRLKKEGVIRGEHMYLNPLSVGYESIAEIGILTDLGDKDKVKALLKTKPSMTVTPTPIGKYDICGILFAHKFSELSALVQQIDIKPLVKNLDVLIFTDLWDNPWHPENLIISPLEKVEKRSCRQKKTFTPMNLNEADLNICRALMHDSRTPFKDIASSLGVSTSYVTERYRLLREKNVLNLSSITVNLPKLGYKANADSYIKVTNRGDLPEVEERLLEIPNLTFCAKFVGGAYDFRIAVNVQDFKGVDSMKQAIYAIDNIKHAEFYIFVNPIFWFSDFIGGNLI